MSKEQMNRSARSMLCLNVTGTGTDVARATGSMRLVGVGLGFGR
jgi:hypothetical protein